MNQKRLSESGAMDVRAEPDDVGNIKVHRPLLLGPLGGICTMLVNRPASTARAN